MHDKGDHPHDHPSDRHADGVNADHEGEAKAASKLPWVLLLTSIFFVIELIAAKRAHSEALRADAIHLLADVLAIAIAYAAFKLADRRPSARFTFGLRRVEAVAALFNALLVIAGAAEIVHEGIGALHEGGAPRTGIMLAVAGSALVIHGINATLLHHDLNAHHGHGHAHGAPHVHAGPHATGGGGTGLNVRGAWLHVVGDALGAFFALMAAAAMRFGAPPAVDPIASFLVAVLLVVGGVRLVREAILVLMEAAPEHLPVEAIEKTVNAIDGVRCVHRLRVWSLGTGYDAIAMHVSADASSHPGLAAQVEAIVRATFHVDYVCVQVDPLDSVDPAAVPADSSSSDAAEHAHGDRT